MKAGPIILVEDDEEDQFLFKEALETLNIKNELKCFSDGMEAIGYLSTTKDKPLLIVCDVNMPRMNGLQLREQINSDEYLKKKSIPFVFLTTSTSKEEIKTAYDLTVQGFFVKPNRFDDFVRMINLVVDYWCTCKHPNAPDIIDHPHTSNI